MAKNSKTRRCHARGLASDLYSCTRFEYADVYVHVYVCADV